MQTTFECLFLTGRRVTEEPLELAPVKGFKDKHVFMEDGYQSQELRMMYSEQITGAEIYYMYSV